EVYRYTSGMTKLIDERLTFELSDPDSLEEAFREFHSQVVHFIRAQHYSYYSPHHNCAQENCADFLNMRLLKALIDSGVICESECYTLHNRIPGTTIYVSKEIAHSELTCVQL